MSETSIAVQNVEEKRVAITPIERLTEGINKHSRRLRRGLMRSSKEMDTGSGTSSKTGSRLRWICSIRSM